MSEHLWMEHDKTGHRAQLPDLPYWRANGWEPCDGPPPEPDLLHDQDPAPAEPAKQAPPAKQASKTAKSEES